MCGITGSGSGATAALVPAPAIATAVALALTATAIALDPANTSSASPFALSATYAALLLPFSAIVIALCLATGGVAIQPYCLASASALYPDLRCVVVLLFVEPYLHQALMLFLPTEILFHCLCIVRARKLTIRLLRRNKELIMHFKAETMMTLHCASTTQLHGARNLILL